MRIGYIRRRIKIAVRFHEITVDNANKLLHTTPSVPNYKSFQESWRANLSQSLTKIIDRNMKIYEIK